MEVLEMMTCEERASSIYVYHVDGHTITLNKDIVDRFSNNVCPVDEEYLSSGVELFGRDGSGNSYPDEIISSLITTDMVQDLNDYNA